MIPDPDVVNSVEWSPDALYVAFQAATQIAHLALVVALSALVLAGVPVFVACAIPFGWNGLVGLFNVFWNPDKSVSAIIIFTKTFNSIKTGYLL